MKLANEVLRFLLELAILVAFGWFGWWLGGNVVVSLLLAVLFVAVFVVIWGLFAAPKRRFATPGWVPGLLFTALGVAAGMLLAATGLAILGLVLVVLVVVNEIARLLGLEVADRG